MELFNSAYLLPLALIIYLFKAKGHVYTQKMATDELKCIFPVSPQVM
jgi:hypothetical protein